jgi:hypothetical protein
MEPVKGRLVVMPTAATIQMMFGWEEGEEEVVAPVSAGGGRRRQQLRPQPERAPYEQLDKFMLPVEMRARMKAKLVTKAGIKLALSLPTISPTKYAFQLCALMESKLSVSLYALLQLMENGILETLASLNDGGYVPIATLKMRLRKMLDIIDTSFQ